MFLDKNAIAALVRYVRDTERTRYHRGGQPFDMDNKIDQIKKLRELTGFGLKLSKDLIEAAAEKPRDPVSVVLEGYN